MLATELSHHPLSPTSAVVEHVGTAVPNQPVSVKPIRVCHVSMCLQTGGLERLLVDFARFHNRQRFQIQFVGLSSDGQPADDIRNEGCSVRVLNESLKIRKGKSIVDLSRHLKSEQIDIVHTHNTYAHFYGALAAKLAGIPVVINTQHGRGCGKGWKARWQFRIANRLTNFVVGVSHDAAELCRGQDPASREKIIAIWNGINLDRFTFRGPKLEPTAISVARLSREKDFPTLLKAIPLVLPHVPEFRLRIVGDGPERENIERLIDELNLRRCVEMLGERQDVAELLAQSGFFVSATRTEGISLTLLEAMAVGLPIVTTRVGGNPEIVVDGQTGRLVPSEDPTALAHAIIEMCHEQEAWSAMSLLARRRVAQNFEIQQMVRSYETLYGEFFSEAGQAADAPTTNEE